MIYLFTFSTTQYGEIEEMNVCDNLGDHLVGNVYVKFRFEEDAEKAVNDVNNRWYNGKWELDRFKVNNRNTWTLCDTCSKLSAKTLIIDFVLVSLLLTSNRFLRHGELYQHTSHIVLVFQFVDFEQANAGWVSNILHTLFSCFNLLILNKQMLDG